MDTQNQKMLTAVYPEELMEKLIKQQLINKYLYSNMTRGKMPEFLDLWRMIEQENPANPVNSALNQYCEGLMLSVYYDFETIGQLLRTMTADLRMIKNLFWEKKF